MSFNGLMGYRSESCNQYPTESDSWPTNRIRRRSDWHHRENQAQDSDCANPRASSTPRSQSRAGRTNRRGCSKTGTPGESGDEGGSQVVQTRQEGSEASSQESQGSRHETEVTPGNQGCPVIFQLREPCVAEVLCAERHVLCPWLGIQIHRRT